MGIETENDILGAKQLLSFIERIERLTEEAKTIKDDIKDVYAEAKANGFDTKVLKQLVKERSQDADDRDEFETLLDVYRRAVEEAVQKSLPFGDDSPRTKGPPAGSKGASARH